MDNQTETIRKFVNYINNPSESGGYWLPNIQRHFVWKEEQIKRLYDSILREYPIGSLLVWKNNSSIKTRKFIDHYHDNINPNDFSRTTDTDKKMLVLDGQQRIQSLYIGLKGSYNKKDFYFNILSGDLTAPDDIKYEFSFLPKSKAEYPWIKFKDLVLTDKRPREIIEQVLNEAPDKILEDKRKRLEDNIFLTRDVFCTQENIIYQVVDSIDRPRIYAEDDIVEIFIRANSGGTTLSKSDLMFSLLTASWEDADENMTDLLKDLNRTGYDFSRDFILKLCLVLLHKGAKYEVKKFRKESTKNQIIQKWPEIEKAIKGVKDFIYGSTFLKTDKQVSSYNTLIPLIYMRYHFPEQWNEYRKDYNNYLLRTSLSGALSGSSDNILDKLIGLVREEGSFDRGLIFDAIRDSGRNLKVSEDTILGLRYDKKEIHLFFNIWYGFNYQPALDTNQPQVDHIFPQSALKSVKDISPATGRRSIMRYKWYDRDQIANLMLLTAEENGAGGKSDTMPEDWFADKPEEYLDLHLIPKDRDLWTLDRFEDFVEARKELILDKFDYLIFEEQEEYATS